MRKIGFIAYFPNTYHYPTTIATPQWHRCIFNHLLQWDFLGKGMSHNAFKLIPLDLTCVTCNTHITHTFFFFKTASYCFLLFFLFLFDIHRHLFWKNWVTKIATDGTIWQWWFEPAVTICIWNAFACLYLASVIGNIFCNKG